MEFKDLNIQKVNYKRTREKKEKNINKQNYLIQKQFGKKDYSKSMTQLEVINKIKNSDFNPVQADRVFTREATRWEKKHNRAGSFERPYLTIYKKHNEVKKNYNKPPQDFFGNNKRLIRETNKIDLKFQMKQAEF